MYLRFYFSIIIEEFFRVIRGRERQFSLSIPRIIAHEENKPVLIIYFKMVLSLIVTGCTFKEYYNLNFIKRKLSNQRTFITTGSNMNVYRKLNDKSYYCIYINKDQFNTIYSDYIARDWIKLSETKNYIYAFFRKHNDIIIKPRDGDSGRGISIIHNCNSLKKSDIDKMIFEYKDCIAEELLYNHPRLSELNSLSLNTMRIVTIRDVNDMSILFAGIRFGADGCEIDNISTGGHIAPIDIISGKICGYSHTKKTVSGERTDKKNFIGFQIPMWEELYEYLYRLTSVVPQMRYMAWDIAITNDGFATIEGNHSSGNTIIQAHLDETQQGLRVKLNDLMAQIIK